MYGDTFINMYAAGLYATSRRQANVHFTLSLTAERLGQDQGSRKHQQILSTIQILRRPILNFGYSGKMATNKELVLMYYAHLLIHCQSFHARDSEL